MPWMPGATKRPISINHGGKRARTDCVILHVSAGESVSLYGWFTNPSAQASSHFYVNRAGGVEQYVDSDNIAWTSGAGNHRQIGIETQGMGDGEWTPQQRESLAEILAWCHKTHGVPLVAMRDSKPTSRGIGWHRLGIDGNFPSLPSILAGRNQRGGGEIWSKSRGKSCPGDDRIPQIPGIIARAVEIAGGKPATPTPTPSHGEVGRVLSIGTTGADVRGLQVGLNKVFPSYSELAVDGSYGPATAAVVEEFQRRAKAAGRYTSTVDGIVGPATRQALDSYGINF